MSHKNLIEAFNIWYDTPKEKRQPAFRRLMDDVREEALEGKKGVDEVTLLVAYILGVIQGFQGGAR